MSMKLHSNALISGVAATVTILLSASACGTAEVSSGSPQAALTAPLEGRLPPLPSPTLAVPDGNRLAFALDATGVQVYTCTKSATGTYAWVFAKPVADLYELDERELAGKHFLATAGNGAGKPTWQWLDDGSSVSGARVAAFTPDPTAIPWLLLSGAAHDGTGRMTKVSYIQRLLTTGGIAAGIPASSSCAADADVGTSGSSPYTARYYFYRPQ
jgi:hypothetical protein